MKIARTKLQRSKEVKEAIETEEEPEPRAQSQVLKGGMSRVSTARAQRPTMYMCVLCRVMLWHGML